jgi:hypothetical protein
MGTMQAQHEFSVNAFGGLQSISFSVTDGTKSGGIGGGGGLGYNYNFNKTWSIGTGVDFAFYGATAKFGQLHESFETFDNSQNTNFDFTANADNMEERLSALLLEIPLTARYTLPVGSNSLRFIGGFKFGLPLSSNYTVSAEQLETRGRYLAEDQTYHDVPDVFTKGKMADHSGSWDANMSVQLTLEAAYRFAIGEKYGLSVGAYFNYGLNDMQAKNDLHPIAFDVNKDSPYSSNSVLNTSFTSSIRPLAVGLKVRFDLGL